MFTNQNVSLASNPVSDQLKDHLLNNLLKMQELSESPLELSSKDLESLKHFACYALELIGKLTPVIQEQ